MKSEYDFSQGKRGAIDPLLPGTICITLALYDDILEWFRSQVHAAGGGNYQNLLNQALQEYIQDRVDLLEKELIFIFNILINFINEPTQKNSSKKLSLSKRISFLFKWLSTKLWVESYFWWEKTSLLVFLFSIVFLVYFNFIKNFQLSNVIQMILLVVMLISYFTFSITKWIRLMKNRKKTQQIILENIEENKQKILKENLIVLDLSKISKENLRFSKAKVIELLEDWQEHYETVDKLIPIISFLIILIPIWIYGIPVNFTETIPYIAATFIIKTIIKPAMEFMAKFFSRPTIRKFKQCLLLLEEAQAIAEAIETDKYSTSSKP